MKKVLIIIGSQKTTLLSTTANIARKLLKEVKIHFADFESETITLGEKNILLCKGCMACNKTGKCTIYDDLPNMIQKMKDADFIVLGSPVHVSHVSATYKNFLDRIHVMMHTFEFLGKPFASIVSTNGSGEEDTLKYINHTALLLGMVPVGSVVHFNNEVFKTKVQLIKLAPQIAAILSKKSQLKPSFKNKLYFWSMKKIIRNNKAYFEYENAVWEQRDWFKKSYKKVFEMLRIE